MICTVKNNMQMKYKFNILIYNEASSVFKKITWKSSCEKAKRTRDCFYIKKTQKYRAVCGLQQDEDAKDKNAKEDAVCKNKHEKKMFAIINV